MTARVYLDWNATTPPLPEALDAMRDVAGRAWGNPSSIHGHGRAATAVVEDARAAVAALTGGDARDVVLTSGGTEANNLAVRSAFENVAKSEPRTLVTSRLEHPSITRVAEALEAEGRARVRWLRVTPAGIVDLADLEAALVDAALVTVQAVNHETGIVQPVVEVIASAHAAGARVHVDAVQAWGKIATASLAGADTMSLAAHKLRGPKGIGALVARPGLRLLPVLLGGAQERGLRPGTMDAALAAGLGVAARHALEGPVRYAPIAAWRDALEAQLRALVSGPNAARVVGDVTRRAPHVSTLVWPGWVGAELVAALDLEGVSVASGAACSAGTVEASPVIAAVMGDGLGATSVRVSLGELTTEAEIAQAIAGFTRVLRRSPSR